MIYFLLSFILSFSALADDQTTGVTGAVLPVAAVSNLPACSSNTKGLMYLVTDALAPVALSVVAAGGAVQVGVVCNGTSWIVQ